MTEWGLTCAKKAFGLEWLVLAHVNIGLSLICMTFEHVEVCIGSERDSSNQLVLAGTCGPRLMVESVEIVLSKVWMSWTIWEGVTILLNGDSWVGMLEVFLGKLCSCTKFLLGFD